jgi:hypothetical protein
VAKLILNVQGLTDEFGPLPGPDRESAHWILYDYRSFNRYFRVAFSESLWRGIINTANIPNAIAGVYFCGFARGTSVECGFYEVLCCLDHLTGQVNKLLDQPLREPLPDIDMFSPVKVNSPQAIEELTEGEFIEELTVSRPTERVVKKTWWQKLRWW